MKITDLDVYTEGLSKSMMDKLFFVGKIPSNPSLIVDYGCGDGTLLKLLKGFYAETSLHGYDNNPEMVRRSFVNNVAATEVWGNIDLYRMHSQSSVILFSTVLHEIAHYAETMQEIHDAWTRASQFDCIVIRDMIPSLTIDRDADIEDVRKVYNHKTYGKLVPEFEKIWGSIHRQKNLVHFLLKYRYVENWTRELRENYFPFYYEDIIQRDAIPLDYKFVYCNHYTLPFIRRQVKQDFGIDVKDNTHLQLILER